MSKIKSYPDINQCKKLKEILPLESADMYYFTIIRDYPYSQGKIKTIAKIMDGSFSSNYDIPCWSLVALLNVIPKHIKDYNVLRIDISDNSFAIWYDEIGYGVNNDLPNITMESAVDACYEMIIKLNELKML